MDTPSGDDTVVPQEAPAPRDSELRERVVAALLGLVAITLMLVFGQWLYVVTPTMLVLGPIVGVSAALSCRRPLDAALLAALAVPLGTWAASQVSVLAWAPVPVWLPNSVQVAALAAVVAAAANWATRSSQRLAPLLAGFAVAAIIAGTFYAGIGAATITNQAGVSIVTMMSGRPTLTNASTDDVLYLHYTDGLRRGQGYYRTVAETLLEGNRTREGSIDAATPLSYRLPALYEFLALFPANGTWIVMAMLAMGSCAAVAAYALARTTLSVPFALAGCTAVAAFYGSVAATPVALFTEPWAGALGLISLALFARSRQGSAHRASLIWASAAAALAAALVRELAAPFLLIGLAASLVEPGSRSRREWLPFLLGIVATTVAYALHVSAVANVVRELGIARQTGPAFPWLNIDGLGLRAMVFRYSALVGIMEPIGWFVAAVACVGAAFGSRERAVRVFAGAVVLGGCVAFLVFHPEGRWDGGLPPAYWADIIVPSLVACISLVFALVPGARRTGGEALPVRGGEAPAGTGPA